MNEHDIRFELSCSLSEWGVDRSDKVRRQFRKMVIETALEYFQTNTCYSNSYPTKFVDEFPSNIHDAYEYYLRCEDVTLPLYACIDNVDTDAWQPYYRRYDKQKQQYMYILKKDFKIFKEKDLNPFKRFEFEPMMKEELFFTKWLLSDDDDDENLETMGKIMESLLACHVIHNECCFNCGSYASLRFNGSSLSSWQDLFCIKCNAMYEVKTKANVKAIEKLFKYNKIPGGSFKNFCELRNTKNAKMFIVLLPRKSVIRNLKRVYPVFVAEIHKGLPQVYHVSFNTNLSFLRLKTVVSILPNTQESWFDLPSPNCDIDVYAIGKKVFIERFSKPTFDHYNSEFFEDNGEDGKELNEDGRFSDTCSPDLSCQESHTKPQDVWDLYT